MKQRLSLVLALALSSALLAGCDRPAGDAASGGKTGSSASGGSSGSAGAGGARGVDRAEEEPLTVGRGRQQQRRRQAVVGSR